MSSNAFLLLLSVGCASYLLWGFRTLPREHWQMMAAVPVRRLAEGPWVGVNLTWYGFFSANAYLVAVALFLVLTGALGMTLPALGLFVAGLLGLCIPASRVVARLVEKKAHTMTVGGAVFTGLVASPLVLLASNRLAAWLGWELLPILPVLAALAVAYAFGEGLGRLACLSFGCCYGKPLKGSPAWLQFLLGRFAMRFFGATKKIAYASTLEGERVLPVQALTALLSVAVGLIGCTLFLTESYGLAYFMVVTVTQLWRVLSEFLRADFRGKGRLTAYQWMGLAGVPYAAALVAAAPLQAAGQPVMQAGLETLWAPGVLLALQGLWLLIFCFTGRSSVTGALLDFHVRQERI